MVYIFFALELLIHHKEKIWELLFSIKSKLSFALEVQFWEGELIHFNRLYLIFSFLFATLNVQAIDLLFGFVFNQNRDLVAELPFILMHPKPEEEEPIPITDRSPGKSIQRNDDANEDASNQSTTGNLIQLDG